MTTLSQVQTILQNLISSIALIDNVILGDFEGNKPKPNTFIRVGILAIVDLMPVPIIETQEDGTIKEIFLKRISFSINCYSQNPVQVLHDLQQKFQSEKTAQLLTANDIALREPGSVKNIPVIEANEILAHANFDPSFDFTDEIVDDLGYFDKVELWGNFLTHQTHQIITA